jgi:hypothetical protein
MRTGAMPPAGMPRPDAPAQAALLTYLESTLDRAAVTDPNPGRVAPHRLNRTEYANAVRDLLALSVDTSTLLPPDDSADGFDNNAGALGASPALLERYLSAAAKISALAVGSPPSPRIRIPIACAATRRRPIRTTTCRPARRGGLLAQHTFPLDGEYTIKVKLLQTNLGSIRGIEDTHQLEITVDGERALLAPVGGEQEYAAAVKNATDIVNLLEARLQTRVFVRAGQRPVVWRFSPGATRSAAGAGCSRSGRSTLIATDHRGVPHVESFTITGPFNPKGPGDTRRAAASCSTCTAGQGRQWAEARTCARSIVSTLARRAYRRPVTEAELTPLLRFYDAGQKEAGLRARRRDGAPRHSRQPPLPDARRARRHCRRHPVRWCGERHRPRIAPLVLPVEQHPRRRTDRGWRQRALSTPGRARRAGAPHAARPEGVRARGQLRRAVAARPQPPQRDAGQERSSRDFDDNLPQAFDRRARSCSSAASSTRTAASST